MPQTEQTKFITQKIVIFGPQGTGKTQLLQSWINSSFNEQSQSTIGADFKLKHLPNLLKLHIWDVAGDKRFKDIVKSYYRGTRLGLYCIDLNNINYDEIIKNIVEYKTCSPAAQVILVGTKSDKASQNVTLQELSQTLGLPFVITSAKNKTGFDDLERNINNVFMNLQIQKDILEAKEIAKELPENKYGAIEQSLDELLSAIQGDPQNLVNKLDELITQCQLDKNPIMRRPILKIVTGIALVLGSALIVFSIGFGIGLLAGSWTGPGAFISGLLVGSKLAYAMVTMGVTGGISGGILTYTLFSETDNKAARNTVENELLPKLEQIKTRVPQVIRSDSFEPRF